jgi:hypothetical protein
MSDLEYSDSENVVIDDTKSQSSTTSMARAVLECPDCKKELQSRVMFNHIRKLHPEYFSSMMKVYKEDDLEDLIKHKKGMPLEWEYKNDFDETEFKNIWGCLACNSTFTVEEKSYQHCCKAKCKAKHASEIKKIIKEEKKEKEKQAKKIKDSRTKWLNRTAGDIYFDTFNVYQVVQLKIFQEYIPFFERLYENTKNEMVKLPEIKPLSSIILNNNKDEMLKQEQKIDCEVSLIQSIIQSFHNNLPLDVISDSLWNKLSKYNHLGGYIKSSCSPTVHINPEYPGVDWGYTKTSL